MNDIECCQIDWISSIWTCIMSITTTTSSSPSTTAKPISTGLSLKTTRFVYERYPKTTLEELHSVFSSQTTSKFDLLSPRVRHHPHQQQHQQQQQRFRTQPVTLTEINETDEENKLESDDPDDPSLSPTGKSAENSQRLDHLALSDHLRRSARKKAPLKNYLERQRLKAMREDPSETDGN